MIAGLAQLVVHLICNQGVGGSIPSAGTTLAPRGSKPFSLGALPHRVRETTSFSLWRMNDHATDSQLDALFQVYRVAVVAFNTASAALMLHLAAKSLPTAQQISAEENARAAVVAARRNLWAMYEDVAAKGTPPAGSLSSRGRSNSDSVPHLDDLEIAPIG